MPTQAVIRRQGPTHFQRESPARWHNLARPDTGRHGRESAHNPKVAGSNPAPATKKPQVRRPAEPGVSSYTGVLLTDFCELARGICVFRCICLARAVRTEAARQCDATRLRPRPPGSLVSLVRRAASRDADLPRSQSAGVEGHRPGVRAAPCDAGLWRASRPGHCRIGATCPHQLRR